MRSTTQIFNDIKNGLSTHVVDYFRQHPKEKKTFLKTEYLGMPPLHIAVLNGHYFLVDFLIREGANIEQQSKPDKLTPFQVTGMQTEPALIDLLVDHGVDINTKSIHGDSALDIAIFQAIQEQTTRYNPVILKLVELGVKTYQYSPENLLPLLMIAASQNDVSFLRDFLPWLKITWPENGEKLYFKIIKETGCHVLLTLAIQNIATDSVDFLVNACKIPLVSVSSMNTMFSGLWFLFERDTFQENYFHLLAKAMPPAELFILPSLLAESNQTSMESFSRKKVEKIQEDLKLYGNMKLFLPRIGDQVKLLSFQCESGVRIEFNDEGQVKDADILLEKVEHLITVFLEKGLDINQRDKEGLSPARYLLSSPVAILERFVAHGLFFTAEDLHEAIQCHHPEVVLYLLHQGIDPSQKVDGKNAMECLHNSLSVNPKLYERAGEVMELIKSKMTDEEAGQYAMLQLK